MSVAEAPAAVAGVRSRARHGVVTFCVALATITYLDRACIGTLAGDIRRDLGLSMQEMGTVFSAFALAYALFEVPSAWWGEVIGTRRVLARIVTWWSAFTCLTAAASGFSSLLAIRFLFGAGEAGAWPNAMRVFSRWIPQRERGRVQGIFFAGAHLAAGLTPFLAAYLQPRLGWRGVFLLFGSFGFLWVVAWLRWFRDQPSVHPAVNPAELAYIEAGLGQTTSNPASKTDWPALLTQRNLWLLCVVSFANSYGFYFVITWLPTFLTSLGMSKVTLAFFSGLPMICAVPADLLGGVTTDFLAVRFGLRLGRALVGGIAYAIAAGSMFAATQTANQPMVAATLLAIGGGASMFALAASWASCIEISGHQSGVASAVMNTAGQVGAIISPLLIAWLVGRSGAEGQWLRPLEIIAGLYLAASACWLFINPEKAPVRSVVRAAATGESAKINDGA